MSDERSPAYSLQNPFHDEPEHAFTVPGQVGYQLGQSDPVLISADVLHLPALQVKHPEWGFLFDADRPRAQTMRLDLLAETSESGLRLAGAHIPFPGVIRVGKRDDGLAFEATDG